MLQKPIVAAALSADGRFAATSEREGQGGTLRMFDLEGGGEVWRSSDPLCVGALRFSPDGARLAAATPHQQPPDDRIRVLEAASGRHQQTLAGHQGWVVSIAFAPDGRLVSGSWDGSARVWSAEGALLARLVLPRKGGVRDVAVSPDGSLILAGGVEWRFSLTADDARWGEASWGALRLWDARSGELLRRFEGPE